MRSSRRLFKSVLAGCILAGLSAPASAAFWWEFASGSNASCASTNGVDCPWGNTRTPSSTSSGAPSVSASAWSNTGGSNPDTKATTGTIENAYLASWGTNGLGVINRDADTLGAFGPSGGGTKDDVEGKSPEHSMDSNDRVDAILFSFGSSVKLTSVTIGWAGTDSDITVLAYTGGSPGPTGSWGSLNAGWSLVGNYNDLVANSAKTINAGGTSSAYWLITAGNTAYGSPSDGADYVKLLKLYGDTPGKTPEPGSLGLLGIAALGFWRLRRKA
jgi:hypothetical protein